MCMSAPIAARNSGERARPVRSMRIRTRAATAVRAAPAFGSIRSIELWPERSDQPAPSRASLTQRAQRRIPGKQLVAQLLERQAFRGRARALLCAEKPDA